MAMRSLVQKVDWDNCRPKVIFLTNVGLCTYLRREAFHPGKIKKKKVEAMNFASLPGFLTRY